MSELVSRLPLAATCPSCHGALRWYHLLLGTGIGPFSVLLTCPTCRAKLGPGPLLKLMMQVVGVVALWGVLFVTLFHAQTDPPGFLALFGWLALALALVEVLYGLVRLGYVRCRKELVVQVGGWPRQQSARPVTFLRRTLARLALWAALISALILLPRLVGPLQWFQPSLPDGPELTVIGKVDPDWKLLTLDGQEVPFSTFQGRAVFLNIWATWCRPCLMEIPSIQDLHDALKDEGVAVILVTQESPDRVRRFVEQREWHVPVYVTGRLPAVIQTDGIPATFALNRRGEIVYRHVGMADWNTEKCRAVLRRLQREG